MSNAMPVRIPGRYGVEIFRFLPRHFCLQFIHSCVCHILLPFGIILAEINVLRYDGEENSEICTGGNL